MDNMKKKITTENYLFTLNANPVTTTTKFKRYDEVFITGCKVNGFIDEIWEHKGGIQYSVIYYRDEKRESAWFYSRELELL